ncbi:hypothetical protein NIT60_04105 [Mammaliicoccus sciuri]|nr:hypothetical protein NIT60_04105 [Mammaliicoccus sciuri]
MWLEADAFIAKEIKLSDQVEVNRDAFNRLNDLVKVQVLDQLMAQYVKRRYSEKSYKEWMRVFNNFSKQSVIPISDDWQFIVAYDKLLLCEDIEFNLNSKFINRNEQYVFGNWLIETKDIASPLFVRTRMSGDRVQYYNREINIAKKLIES